MDLEELFSRAHDSLVHTRVFGEPYERNGVTVIPAAAVGGGAGGGGGGDPEGGEGSGGGFGLSARPAGAIVIADGAVTWRPAVDANRALATFGAVAIVYLLTRWRLERTRARSLAATRESA